MGVSRKKDEFFRDSSLRKSLKSHLSNAKSLAGDNRELKGLAKFADGAKSAKQETGKKTSLGSHRVQKDQAKKEVPKKTASKRTVKQKKEAASPIKKAKERIAKEQANKKEKSDTPQRPQTEYAKKRPMFRAAQASVTFGASETFGYTHQEAQQLKKEYKAAQAYDKHRMQSISDAVEADMKETLNAEILKRTKQYDVISGLANKTEREAKFIQTFGRIPNHVSDVLDDRLKYYQETGRALTVAEYIGLRQFQHASKGQHSKVLNMLTFGYHKKSFEQDVKKAESEFILEMRASGRGYVKASDAFQAQKKLYEVKTGHTLDKGVMAGKWARISLITAKNTASALGEITGNVTEAAGAATTGIGAMGQVLAVPVYIVEAGEHTKKGVRGYKKTLAIKKEKENLKDQLRKKNKIDPSAANQKQLNEDFKFIANTIKAEQGYGAYEFIDASYNAQVAIKGALLAAGGITLVAVTASGAAAGPAAPIVLGVAAGVTTGITVGYIGYKALRAEYKDDRKHAWRKLRHKSEDIEQKKNQLADIKSGKDISFKELSGIKDSDLKKAKDDPKFQNYLSAAASILKSQGKDNVEREDLALLLYTVDSKADRDKKYGEDLGDFLKREDVPNDLRSAYKQFYLEHGISEGRSSIGSNIFYRHMYGACEKKVIQHRENLKRKEKVGDRLKSLISEKGASTKPLADKSEIDKVRGTKKFKAYLEDLKIPGVKIGSLKITKEQKEELAYLRLQLDQLNRGIEKMPDLSKFNLNQKDGIESAVNRMVELESMLRDPTFASEKFYKNLIEEQADFVSAYKNGDRKAIDIASIDTNKVYAHALSAMGATEETIKALLLSESEATCVELIGKILMNSTNI